MQKEKNLHKHYLFNIQVQIPVSLSQVQVNKENCINIQVCLLLDSVSTVIEENLLTELHVHQQ